MQYVAFEEGIEVQGRTVWSIVDGFGTFKMLAAGYLAAEGIGEVDHDGNPRIDLDAWYGQSAWLRVFEKIGAALGPRALFNIGVTIPRNATFPPWVVDVHSAIRSVDVAYHMNHRKAGQLMFDPDTGAMLEGIGHYGYAGDGAQRRIVSRCNNPYPCAFDHGILTTMARRFAANAKVEHEQGSPCREKGAEGCTYVISW